MGLDIGERRIGVAISDPDGKVATPLTVLDGPLSACTGAMDHIFEDYEIGLVVLGLPLGMSGQEGPQAARVRAEGEALADRLPVRVVYHDERLSSAQAERVMAQSGVTSKKRRGSVDMVAAAIILQSYLDSSAEENDR